MPVFQAKRRVAVPPSVAFEVAADVAAYQEFLPLLQRSAICGKRTQTASGEVFDAELTIAYAKLGLNGSFVSRVETHAAERAVLARSTDAPFKAIETEWRVVAVGEHCDVSIRIDYAFRNPLLQLAAGGVLQFAIQKVMESFETRAKFIQRSTAKSN
jgi:coenzyme Q-binding protein COQ10